MGDRANVVVHGWKDEPPVYLYGMLMPDCSVHVKSACTLL